MINICNNEYCKQSFSTDDSKQKYCRFECFVFVNSGFVYVGDEIQKRCRKCGQIKTLDSYTLRYRNGKAAHRSQCKKCSAEKSLNSRRTPEGRKKYEQYREKTREKVVKRNSERRKQLREEVITAYGKKCVCCGETEPKFLAVDHIYNDGAEHRKQVKTKSIYLWLKRNNFPKDRFQLLCHNCNFSKGLYGCCPHQEQNRY